jgi:hypothetical protein
MAVKGAGVTMASGIRRPRLAATRSDGGCMTLARPASAWFRES